MKVPFLQQPLGRQVWMQAIARLLYQGGYGAIQFFIPLIFVNRVGFSATLVGLGIGVGSLAGIAGHFLGGYLSDSPHYGRKQALLFSGGLSLLAAGVLALTQNLSLLMVANLLMGLSAGCYWTAADASVMDATLPEQRHQAFAILVLADTLGGGFGILSGGLVLSLIDSPQLLFLVNGIVLLVFLVLIQVAIAEVQREDSEPTDPLQGFVAALGDRALQLFVLVNILFTTYIALVNSTLPLYFTTLVSETDASLGSISNLFTWCYLGVGSVLQLPLVNLFKPLMGVSVLMVSMGLWGVGFLLVWAIGMVNSTALIWMMLPLAILSIATAVYKPFATTMIAQLAPQSLRGVYLAISYQCWSIGYFIGPIFGGWAMDQSSSAIAHRSWLVVALTTLSSFFILHDLGQRQVARKTILVPEDPAEASP